MLISAGMELRNKNKFRYGTPAYPGPFRALDKYEAYMFKYFTLSFISVF
jgi:hypothetical protein